MWRVQGRSSSSSLQSWAPTRRRSSYRPSWTMPPASSQSMAFSACTRWALLWLPALPAETGNVELSTAWQDTTVLRWWSLKSQLQLCLQTTHVWL